MLAASLRGVVAQLLMKRHDGGGRCAVNEIMISNSAVGAIIRDGATHGQDVGDILPRDGRGDDDRRCSAVAADVDRHAAHQSDAVRRGDLNDVCALNEGDAAARAEVDPLLSDTGCLETLRQP
jgi:hypothetical protein